MATKLYIGNMSYSTTEDGLREAFSKAGTVVSTSVINDKITGRPRGFGFVEMEDADAQAAIAIWNEKDLDGRTLVVNEARPMQPRQGGQGGGMR